MTPNTVLWGYIVLLVAGGVMGFVKAKSTISLVTAIGSAAVLCLCAVGVLRVRYLADLLLVLLLVVFLVRWSKGRKFMPAGLMSVLTVLALALRHLL